MAQQLRALQRQRPTELQQSNRSFVKLQRSFPGIYRKPSDNAPNAPYVATGHFERTKSADNGSSLSSDDMMLHLSGTRAAAQTQHSPGGPGENADRQTAGERVLLGCETPDELRVHLAAVLALDSTDPTVNRMQRRIRKALAVFGEDVLCVRLHALLIGDTDSREKTGGTSNENVGSKAGMHV